MNPIRRRRLLLILALVVAAAVAVTLVAMALQRNVAYLYTPSEVRSGEAGPQVASGQARFRLGGMVEEGSFKRAAGSMEAHFQVTDGDALSPITAFDGDLAPLAYLDFTTGALPYHLLDEPHVLILGAGGGADVLLALSHGARPIDAPIVPGGPAAYLATLPVRAAVTALQAAGLPAQLSMSAGTFVCNHVFYGLMHLAATRGRPFRGGFLHVPCLPQQAQGGRPSLPLADIVRGIEIVLEAAASGARD